ncbi:MAG TPA: HDOD domain-containing protein, partial [Spirochaetia bacterium]|nr:HDOD domain-containing protein [Spirochaetia bacterium]
DPARYQEILKQEQETGQWAEKLEFDLFGVDHKSMGGELFRSWNFPDTLIDTALEHDNLNITSPHKSLIIFVTLAGLLADRLGYGAFSPPKKTLLETLLPYTDLSREDIEAYGETYLTKLAGDSFYRECQELFNLD